MCRLWGCESGNNNASALLVECRAQIQSSAFFPGPRVSWNNTFWLGYKLSHWQSQLVQGPKADDRGASCMTGGQLFRKTSQNTTPSVSLFQTTPMGGALWRLVIRKRTPAPKGRPLHMPSFSLRLLASGSQFMNSDLIVSDLNNLRSDTLFSPS